MTERKYIRYELDGAVATLTINRPERLNALDREVLREIESAAREAANDPSIRCMIVTGEGKAFVAGADISEMKSMSHDDALAFAQAGHNTFALLESLAFPVIAAVNGFALGGGCELALACDFIHASEKAKFGQPEVRLGVIPGFGGTQRLARRVGIARARELVFTAGIIDAAEALRIGLVNGVHAPDALLTNVRTLAQTIATMGPRAVKLAKDVLRDGEGLRLGDANRLEIDAFARCFSTSDQKEGMAAFLEKRAATFKNQ